MPIIPLLRVIFQLKNNNLIFFLKKKGVWGVAPKGGRCHHPNTYFFKKNKIVFLDFYFLIF
jgi:hypothetical protein